MDRTALRLADPPAATPSTPGYLDLHRADPLQRIAFIKKGVRARFAKHVLSELAISQAAGSAALNLPLATINRKVARDDILPPAEGERVIGLARLIGQLQAMIEESGEAKGFDATAWLSRWLQEPLRALGGAAPVTFMDTMEGQALVSQALAQTQSGAYA